MVPLEHKSYVCEQERSSYILKFDSCFESLLALDWLKGLAEMDYQKEDRYFVQWCRINSKEMKNTGVDQKTGLFSAEFFLVSHVTCVAA